MYGKNLCFGMVYPEVVPLGCVLPSLAVFLSCKPTAQPASTNHMVPTKKIPWVRNYEVIRD